MLVGVGLLLSLLPGLPEALEYDRRAVAEGQLWRIFTGQLVHWTPRMTVVDLGVLLALGVWLERRSARIFVGSLVVAAVLVGIGVHVLARDLSVYRGSSGLATAAFAAAALVLLRDGRRRPIRRGLGLLVILLVVSKIFWEAWRGAALAAGRFPPDVQVTPLVHVIGAFAGLATSSAFLLLERNRRVRRDSA